MMMLVLTLLVRGGGAYEFTSKAELSAACQLWVTDQSTAQATYGHISTFGTGQITDMSYLFCGYDCSLSWCSECNTAMRYGWQPTIEFVAAASSPALL